jgi:glyoxylase-like metal-dependent hydrolase (beta-lactamase superfamily II)
MRIVLLVLLASAAPLAQRGPSLSVKELKPGIYLVQGGGGNSGVVIGSGGVVVIDAKETPDAGKALIAEVAKLTPKPITHVILTHSDADHVGGLAAFPTNVAVIAHAGAKVEMEEANAGARGAQARNRLPTQVVARTGENLTLQGVRFELRHWAPAHTGGDLTVILPEARVAFSGDLTANTADPLIRLEKRGSSEGWISSMKGLLGFRVQFVPGHGNVQTGTELQAVLSASAQKRDWVVSLTKEGKTLDDIKRTVGDPVTPPPARPAAPPPSPRGSAAPGPAVKGRAPAPAPVRAPVVPLTFTEAVYQELTKRS